MKTCAYILHGLLYMENYHTETIKQYWIYHRNLIRILSNEFKITIFFITSNLTPPEYIEWAKNKGIVFLFNYNNSSIFNILHKGLCKIEYYESYMIHRTNVKYHDNFYKLFRRIQIPQEITALNKILYQYTNDIFFWFPFNKKKHFQNNIKYFKNNTYDIDKRIYIEYLSNTSIIKRNGNNNLFELQNVNKTSIVIYSVPKSGTHYLSNIITLLLNPSANIYNKEEMYNYVPNILELKNIDFFSTHPMHISYNNFNYNHKFIMVIRNPLDVVISNYFFYETRKLKKQQRTIYKYINDTLENVIFQINNMKQLYENNNNNILIRYEDLHINFEKVTLKIIDFINTHMPNLINDFNIDEIKEKVSFQNVQNKEKQNGLYKVGRIQKTLFHRSGKINQITEYLSPILLNMLLKKIPNSMFELFPEMNELLQKKPIKKKPKKKINQINKLIWFK